MHNMLEEYYKFLCERLISWARSVEISEGDRYVLSFEDQQQVKSFMDNLSGLDSVTPFKIQQGLAGFSFPVSESKRAVSLVVVSTNNVTPDYLVNLRNQIGRQKGIWEHTALLFVSDRILDSINSGAKDISRQGGPFNLEKLRKNLNGEINGSSSLNDKEKVALKDIIKESFKGENSFTLMDFADAYAIIEKGTLENSDFTQMGYFQDKSLLAYSDDEIGKRLESNRNDFSEVGLLQGFGNTEEKLQGLVSGDKLTHELAGKNWQEVDYGRILIGKDELSRVKKIKISYLSEKLQAENPEFTVWDRAQKNTAAGLRNRQIVVFNNHSKSNIEIKIPFDQLIKLDGLSQSAQKSKNPQIQPSGHSLKCKFILPTRESTFASKVIYKHQGTLRFTFNVLIVPFKSTVLVPIQPIYNLKVRAHNYAIQLPSDIAEFKIGTGQITNTIVASTFSDLKELTVNENECLRVKLNDFELTDDSADNFTILISGHEINFSLIDEGERVVPRSAVYLENYRRQHGTDGHYINKQVAFGSSIFSVYDSQKKFLQSEVDALTNRKLLPLGMTLSTELKQKYKLLFDALQRRQTIMSLVNWDGEIKGLVQSILAQIMMEISQSENHIELSDEVRGIVHIGERIFEGGLRYAPFSPILLGYQLQVENRIHTEILTETMERKLNPVHLVPFLQRDSRDYRAYYDGSSPRWLVYSQNKLAKFSEVSQKIVTERLKDFVKHFGYLFSVNDQSSYNIRAVNIEDEKSLIKSVTDYLIYQISQSKGIANPVALYLVNRNHKKVSPIINEFYALHSRKDYEEFFNDQLKSIKNIAPEQVINLVQKRLNIFYGSDKQIDYHVTLYQFANQLTLGQYEASQLTMNYTIGGLIGGNEYTNVQGSIKSGFGTKGLVSRKDKQLLELSSCWNELIVATAQRHGVMAHGQTLTNNIEELDSSEFQLQFDRSEWVTLLNPEVKLDYFNQMNQDVYVIHYTDYTNSANYESITLTKQVEQYETILSENLPTAIEQHNNSEFLTNIIKSFNVINGEWLLRLVSHQNQSNTVKEKLSILAAYKELLGILKTNDVIWIPLSLEEILRVSGSFVGETRGSTIFSAKSLGAKGSISDDLLFIGLWHQGKDLKVTFLPTEVKAGINSNGVIGKATSQVNKTYSILNEAMFNIHEFKGQFYLDFFMKLFFANVDKLFSNGSMSEGEYRRLQTARKSIVQGQFELDNSLTDDLKNKVIFSLKAKEVNRSLRTTEDYTLVKVPVDDAFRVSGMAIKDVISAIQDGKFGFDRVNLLANKSDSMQTKKHSIKYSFAESDVSSTAAETTASYPTETSFSKNEEESNTAEVDESHKKGLIQETERRTSIGEKYEDEQIIEKQDKGDKVNLKTSKRILLGTLDGSTSKVYWEYGSKQLANRHMLITGKSGQGKTYFMQTLLLEFARHNIDSLVLDYTDSYLPGQLDPILERNVDQIAQHIVMQENLAINPFKFNTYSIGEFRYEEKSENVVARVAEVLDFVFNLGIQQKSRLINIMNEGIKNNQHHYTFSQLREQLVDGKEDMALYGRLQPLLDNDPFTYSNSSFDWSDYFGDQGKINIIQLSRFPASVKNAMIEFVLWDLYDYSQMHMDKHLVYPVFLDEVQNLNFARESPTVKILTEGRKFGWSGIFATQSLGSIKGEADAIFNPAEQIHFLPPESQTRALSKTLSSDSNGQKEFEQELSRLQKGQCIVNGPMQEGEALIKQAKIVNIDSLMDRIAH